MQLTHERDLALRSTGDGHNRLRLPNFIVIGTMKSGTTTLFRWLGDHQEVWLPAVKEPNFFSDDRQYERGSAAYAEHFAECPPDRITGEASVRYTDPRWSEKAATRVKETLVDPRLVCLLRDPADRMRSHYRHEVQRNREHRRFPEAVNGAGSVYVERSCYATALRPWLSRFGTEQLHVTTFEALVGSDDAWPHLLRFLGLSLEPRPSSRYNVTADKAAFSPLMRWLWDSGLAARLPRPRNGAGRIARRVLLRDPSRLAELMASTKESFSDDVTNRLEREVDELESLLPSLHPVWSTRARG